MSSQFSPKVSEILSYSREEAARLASRSVGPEHLLLGLLRMKDGLVIDTFNRLNLNLQNIKTELENRVREDEIGMPIYTHELVLNEKASNILKLDRRTLRSSTCCWPYSTMQPTTVRNKY